MATAEQANGDLYTCLTQEVGAAYPLPGQAGAAYWRGASGGSLLQTTRDNHRASALCLSSLLWAMFAVMPAAASAEIRVSASSSTASPLDQTYIPGSLNQKNGSGNASHSAEIPAALRASRNCCAYGYASTSDLRLCTLSPREIFPRTAAINNSRCSADKDREATEAHSSAVASSALAARSRVSAASFSAFASRSVASISWCWTRMARDAACVACWSAIRAVPSAFSTRASDSSRSWVSIEDSQELNQTSPTTPASTKPSAMTAPHLAGQASNGSWRQANTTSSARPKATSQPQKTSHWWAESDASFSASSLALLIPFRSTHAKRRRFFGWPFWSALGCVSSVLGLAILTHWIFG